EEALRASEEQYRALFDTNPLPLFVIAPDDLAFLAVNQAAVRHYRYSADRFAAMTFADLLRPDSRVGLDLLKATIDAIIGSATSGAGSDVHLRADGTLIEVELTANRLTFRGRPAILVLANDVTKRRRAEETLRQSEEQL